MTNLEILHVTDNCGVTDDEIKDLNLIELHSQYNNNITINGIKHMTKLIRHNKYF